MKTIVLNFTLIFCLFALAFAFEACKQAWGASGVKQIVEQGEA